MNVLIWSLFLLIIAFGVHLLLWKISLPKRQTKVLLQVFFGSWIVAVLWARFNPTFTLFGFPVPLHITDYLHMAVFHTSFTLAYMITYSALEADSPTLVMIRAIEKAGTAGLEKLKLEEALNDDILVKPRVRDLLRDQMVYMCQEKYMLTSKGKLFVGIFKFYRDILRASKGG